LKIRIGYVKNGAVQIKKGATLNLTPRKITGDSQQVQVAYPRLIKDLKNGDDIFIDDGLIHLKVMSRGQNQLVTKVIEGGLLKDRKGVNFPGVKVSSPIFTKKDIDDLALGIKLGVDYIAVSFVRSRADILRVKNRLKKNNADIPVIAKIENRQALENIDEIMDISDGLMIARGDLGVEVPPEEVPLIQKQLIEKCNKALKPVITATQMLDSMTDRMRPTRAETTDVANAVLDGTDALMLSAETAVGNYPVRTVKMMDRIINYTESHGIKKYTPDIAAKSFAAAVAEAACSSAIDIDAKTIAAFTRSGFTALLVSKFRPVVPVTGFTVSDDIRRRMNLYWGITPHVMKFPNNTDQMISESEKTLRKKGIVKKGDTITIIATSPFTLGGNTNIMKLHKVGA
jgi:pyruvate kinase